MAINLRTNFPDLVLDDALPALEMVIEEEYQAFKPVSELLFNIKDMKTGIAQSAQVSSLSTAASVSEGEPIPQQRIYQGFSKTYTALKYGILMGVSQEMLDDDPQDIMQRNPKRFARAFMSAQETSAAAIFNNGFATTGPDGKVLFATDHPSLAPGGAPIDNLVTAADLSSATLKAHVTKLRSQQDTAGNKIQIRPKYLVVHPNDEFLAAELLHSALLVDSSNASVNAINSVKNLYNIEPVVYDYLTDGDATFLVADKLDHYLCWYWRKRPVLASDYEFKSEVALMKMSGRWAVGYSDFRGVTGCAGTG